MEIQPQKNVVRPPSTGGANKILLIDDNGDIRFLLARKLSKSGYEVTEAFDGPDGLLKFQPGKFAVVVCDRKMPGKYGDEVIPEIKRMDPHQKVIMCTDQVSILTNQDKDNIQADIYVEKEQNALLAAVQQLVKRTV